MKVKNGFINETEVNEIVTTHDYNCPRILVYRALTEPDRISEWWTPKGFKITALTLELNSGGVFHFGMEAPDGNRIWGKFEFIEVVPPEKIVFIAKFADEKGNDIKNPFNQSWPLEMLIILTLSESIGLIGHESIRTTLTIRGGPIHASNEEKNAFSRSIDTLLKSLNETLFQAGDYIAHL
jgi:uncharacterized protein YndB with AHSA1/START domain